MKKLFSFIIFISMVNIVYGQLTSNKNHFINKHPETKGLTNIPKYEIVGQGGLRELAGNSASENPLTGSIGLVVNELDYDLEVGFVINEFEAQEINTPDLFARNLLITDLNQQSFSANYKKYINSDNGKNLKGIQFQTLLAIAEWKIDSVRTYKSSPFTFKALFTYSPFVFDADNGNNIDLEFGFGYTLRGLFGDITNEDEIRQQYYGTEQTFFNGIEITASLKINDVNLFMNIPILFSKDDINGLTGGQAQIGASLTGTLHKFPKE